MAVRDDGGGIAPEHAARLFQPYFTTKKHGTGLGLFVTRQLVADHGGTVDFESPAEGGAVFRVRLPLAPAVRREPAADRWRPRPGARAASWSRRRPRRAVPAASILVVDDEPLIRDTLAEYLGQEGFAVAACASGEEALARPRERRFDVALCDVQLPGMDGLELLERLQRISPETFVLLITAYATVENAVEAFQRGAHDYLMKPILLDEVLAKIRRLLAHRDLHLENQWLRRELNRDRDPGQIVGRSPAMQQVFALVRKVAPTRSTVLHHRRKRHRQGVDRAGHPCVAGGGGAARAVAVRGRQLRRHPARPAGESAVRPSQGRLHRGRPRPGGRVRPCRRRHGLSRRDRRTAAGDAGQAAAGHRAEGGAAGRRQRADAASRRGCWRRPTRTCKREVEAGPVPRGPVLPAQRGVHPRAAVARAAARTFPIWSTFLLAKHARALGKRMHGVTHEAMQLLLACRWKGNVRELDNALQRAVILGEGPLVDAGRPAARPGAGRRRPGDRWTTWARR